MNYQFLMEPVLRLAKLRQVAGRKKTGDQIYLYREILPLVHAIVVRKCIGKRGCFCVKPLQK